MCITISVEFHNLTLLEVDLWSRQTSVNRNDSKDHQLTFSMAYNFLQLIEESSAIYQADHFALTTFEHAQPSINLPDTHRSWSFLLTTCTHWPALRNLLPWKVIVTKYFLWVLLKSSFSICIIIWLAYILYKWSHAYK